MTRRAKPDSPPGSPTRRWLWISLALALAGLVLALWLVRLHVEALVGVRHACTVVGTSFDCDRVTTSRYSVFLGLPVALWGVFGYAFAAALAVWGLAPRRARATWPIGLLFLVAAVALAASLVLAAVSKLLIGAWCLYCMASWVVAAALLAVAWRAGSMRTASRPALVPRRPPADWRRRSRPGSGPVNATSSYVVNSVLFSGRLPAGAIPPRPPQANR